MRHRPVIPHHPARAQSVTGFLDIILQILAVLEAIYNLFIGLFGKSS